MYLCLFVTTSAANAPRAVFGTCWCAVTPNHLFFQQCFLFHPYASGVTDAIYALCANVSDHNKSSCGKFFERNFQNIRVDKFHPKGWSQQGDTAAVCAAAAEVKSVASLFFFPWPNSQLNGPGSKFTAVAQSGPWAPGNIPIAPRPLGHRAPSQVSAHTSTNRNCEGTGEQLRTPNGQRAGSSMCPDRLPQRTEPLPPARGGQSTESYPRVTAVVGRLEPRPLRSWP